MKNEGPNDFYIDRLFLFRHTDVQKKIEISRNRKGKLRSPALFASKNVKVAKKIFLKNEGPNYFHIGRTFLFRHSGQQKKIKTSRNRKGKLHSPALDASKNVKLAKKKKNSLKNEGPNDFYISRLFLLTHTGMQKKI